jgi:hypothetical protein
LRNNTTPDHPKAPFSSNKKPISIHTQEYPKLDYNVVEDLNKLRANISFMDICRIPQQKDFLLQDLNSIEDLMIANVQERNLASTDPVNKPTMNVSDISCLGAQEYSRLQMVRGALGVAHRRNLFRA